MLPARRGVSAPSPHASRQFPAIPRPDFQDRPPPRHLRCTMTTRASPAFPRPCFLDRLGAAHLRHRYTHAKKYCAQMTLSGFLLLHPLEARTNHRHLLLPVTTAFRWRGSPFTFEAPPRYRPLFRQRRGSTLIYHHLPASNESRPLALPSNHHKQEIALLGFWQCAHQHRLFRYALSSPHTPYLPT